MFSYPVSCFAVFWFHCGDSNYSWSFPGYGDHLCSVLKCSPPFPFVFPFIDSASHIHAKAVSSFWWRLVTHESWIVKHGFGIRGQQTDLFYPDLDSSIPVSHTILKEYLSSNITYQLWKNGWWTSQTRHFWQRDHLVRLWSRFRRTGVGTGSTHLYFGTSVNHFLAILQTVGLVAATLFASSHGLMRFFASASHSRAELEPNRHTGTGLAGTHVRFGTTFIPTRYRPVNHRYSFGNLFVFSCCFGHKIDKDRQKCELQVP